MGVWLNADKQFASHGHASGLPRAGLYFAMIGKIQFFTTNKNPDRRVLVTIDPEDAAMMGRSWSAGWDRGRLRAIVQSCTTAGDHGRLLHRLILMPPRGMVVDHADGNPANNSRDNLRICTTSENSMNRGAQKNSRSGVKGVCWHKGRQKWYVQIMAGRKRERVGFFDTVEEARDAYRKAAQELHGEFARTA